MTSKATSVLATPDRVLLRLNKLLAAPGGLSAVLSTFNYTLYLLAYFDAKATPLKARLYLLLNRNAALPKVMPVAPAGPSPIAALASLLSSARTTLRLFGLFPLYPWARQLAQGPKPGQDPVVYVTTVTQCALYIVFQALENIGLLIDSGVLPASLFSQWTAKTGGKPTSIYLTAYRAWFLGICCDFVKILREGQLERVKRSKRSSPEQKSLENWEADKKFDQQWYESFVNPLLWFPLGFQFSELREGNFPGFNLGLMGVCGGLAGLGKTKALWNATAEA